MKQEPLLESLEEDTTPSPPVHSPAPLSPHPPSVASPSRDERERSSSVSSGPSDHDSNTYPRHWSRRQRAYDDVEDISCAGQHKVNTHILITLCTLHR